MQVKLPLTLLFLIQLATGCSQKSSPTQDKNSITLIMMTGHMGLKYDDTTTLSMHMILFNEIYPAIRDAKEKNGGQLNVFIKKSPLVQQEAIDMIKEHLAKNKVDTYYISDIGEKETKLIALFASEIKPPETIQITTPGSVNSTQLPTYPYFHINITEKRTIQYKVDSIGLNTSFTSITIKDSLILSKAIAEYLQLRENKQTEFLISGDNNSKFDEFEIIINALKKNNVFKYKLLTSIDQSKESYLPMPKEEN